MDAVMTLVWIALGVLVFIASLKNPGRLYLYLAVGFLTAAFMAFLGASLQFQVILAILTILTAMIYGEAGINAYFIIFLGIDIGLLLIYFFLFRQ